LKPEAQEAIYMLPPTAPRTPFGQEQRGHSGIVYELEIVFVQSVYDPLKILAVH
jgi:hypothetical protein